MELREAYRIMQKASGIKKGDKVKMLRKANSGEMGWCNPWPLIKNQCVGEVGTVKGIDDDDVKVYFESIQDWFYFPFFIFEIVEAAPAIEITFKINGKESSLKDISEETLRNIRNQS